MSSIAHSSLASHVAVPRLLGGAGRKQEPAPRPPCALLTASATDTELELSDPESGERTESGMWSVLMPSWGTARTDFLPGAHQRRVKAMVIQFAKDDPYRVKAIVAKLRKDGEIAPDDLLYLDRIADEWIKIAQMNQRRARR